MTPQTTPRLSLFQIESELLQLIDQREDALERMAAMSPDELTASPEIGKEIAVVEGLIRQYVHGHLATKQDSYAYIIKEYRARAKARSETWRELKALADKDEATADHIENVLLSVMQELNRKELVGDIWRITRQGNGGKRKLDIRQPDLIPMSLQRVTVEIGADVFRDFSIQFEGHYRAVGGVHPDNADIRGALERGEGVPGAMLLDRGEQIRIK